jgi:hypothetical protein
MPCTYFSSPTRLLCDICDAARIEAEKKAKEKKLTEKKIKRKIYELEKEIENLRKELK